MTISLTAWPTFDHLSCSFGNIWGGVTPHAPMVTSLPVGGEFLLLSFYSEVLRYPTLTKTDKEFQIETLRKQIDKLTNPSQSEDENMKHKT